MTNFASKAMHFAIKAHGDQKRKYTHEPYFVHLAHVAGMVSTIQYQDLDKSYDKSSIVAIAWLHDVIEDCSINTFALSADFPPAIVWGVVALSDLEQGNRERRKELSRIRLADQPKHIQDIKVCDLISNTASIVIHDPDFAKIYLKEKKLLLDVLTKADPELRSMAYEQIKS